MKYVGNIVGVILAFGFLHDTDGSEPPRPNIIVIFTDDHGYADLSIDKEEKHNLLAQQPEIAARLRSKLTRWSSKLSPLGLETKQMSPVWDYYSHSTMRTRPRRAFHS